LAFVSTPGTCGVSSHIDGHRFTVEDVITCRKVMRMSPDEIVSRLQCGRILEDAEKDGATCP
jgi:uncharacterized protein (DUF433 family)